MALLTREELQDCAREIALGAPPLDIADRIEKRVRENPDAYDEKYRDMARIDLRKEITTALERVDPSKARYNESTYGPIHAEMAPVRKRLYQEHHLSLRRKLLNKLEAHADWLDATAEGLLKAASLDNQEIKHATSAAEAKEHIALAKELKRDALNAYGYALAYSERLGHADETFDKHPEDLAEALPSITADAD